MRWKIPRRAVVVLLCIAAAARAPAQCPDGSPPPCRRAGVRNTAAERNESFTVDPRSWIVVPFANDARAPEVEWLRDASVNLLSLDLGRWSDVNVIDDQRVGDLLRALPVRGGALTLNDGLQLARRAHAGTLVMGDFLKVGKTMRIVANVFDAKTGTRVRTAQQTTDTDSLLTAFSPLARAVLAVPLPADAKLGALGTTRVDAYREYLLGVGALNRFSLTDAKHHLEHALALDSTFALAHYKLSLAMHWDDDPDTAEREHALAAARLGANLPPRERALIGGRLALVNGEFEQACAAVRGLVARDSSDAEALYGVGECEYHGGLTTGPAIDSITGQTRGNWNRAIAAFRRVLLLDPAYHPAFEHILDALTKSGFSLCVRNVVGCANDPDSWATWVGREHDSLVVIVTRPDHHEPQLRFEANGSAGQNRRAAQRIAEEWVNAGPGEPRAHLNLAAVDLSLGEVGRAATALRGSLTGGDEYSRLEGLTYRAYIAILLGHGDEARALVDTLSRLAPKGSSRVIDAASLGMALGRIAPVTAQLRETAAQGQWPAERLRYTLALPRIVLGIPGENAAEVEHRYWSSLSSDTTCPAGLSRCRVTALLPSLAYGLTMPRAWWPPFAVAPLGFRFDPAFAVATRNAEALRGAVAELDSVSHARLRAGAGDQAYEVIAVDAALAAGDTAHALAMTRFFVDSVMPAMISINSGVQVGGPAILWKWSLVPRMMLRRGQLAAAAGSVDEAREWYGKVLSLWRDADPELQPTVATIRAAMAALPAGKP